MRNFRICLFENARVIGPFAVFYFSVRLFLILVFGGINWVFWSNFPLLVLDLMLLFVLFSIDKEDISRCCSWSRPEMSEGTECWVILGQSIGTMSLVLSVIYPIILYPIFTIAKCCC